MSSYVAWYWWHCGVGTHYSATSYIGLDEDNLWLHNAREKGAFSWTQAIMLVVVCNLLWALCFPRFWLLSTSLSGHFGMDFGWNMCFFPISGIPLKYVLNTYKIRILVYRKAYAYKGRVFPYKGVFWRTKVRTFYVKSMVFGYIAICHFYAILSWFNSIHWGSRVFQTSLARFPEDLALFWISCWGMAPKKDSGARQVPSKQWSCSELQDGQKKLVAVKTETEGQEQLAKEIKELQHAFLVVEWFHI